MNSDNLIVEARAKVIWGEEASSVCHFLTSRGMSAADAEAKIKEFIVERNEEIRKSGVRKSCLGAAIATGAGVLLYVAFKDSETFFIVERAYSIGLFVALGLVGIWMLVKGLVYVVRPESEKRSITEMSE
jgi:hypothetical protein